MDIYHLHDIWLCRIRTIHVVKINVCVLRVRQYIHRPGKLSCLSTLFMAALSYLGAFDFDSTWPDRFPSDCESQALSPTPTSTSGSLLPGPKVAETVKKTWGVPVPAHHLEFSNSTDHYTDSMWVGSVSDRHYFCFVFLLRSEGKEVFINPCIPNYM